MISEQDEFLLSRLLDGDLSESDAAALHVRIGREPELSKALAQLQRLEALLAAQRMRQAPIDSQAMRNDIMDAVHASRRSSLIRFPFGRWAVGALAAAAAIALAITMYRPAGTRSIEAPVSYAFNVPAPRAVAPSTPPVGRPAPSGTTSASPQGAVLVQFNRPARGGPGAAPARVSFARSDQQARQMQARDEEYRSRPMIRVVLAQRSRSRAALAASPFDAPL